MHVLWDCKPRSHHLPCTLAGDRPPLSLPISSSTPLTSKQRPLLFTLTSELALLLVARGESETLTVLLRAGPDLTLYIEDAGIFVINGRKLPGMVRLISCNQKLNQILILLGFNWFWDGHQIINRKRMITMWRIAISRDFFESVLPKPELSGDEDDFPELPWGDCLSSCLGGASFRIFITLSTIFVPIKTGLTLSLTLERPRLNAGTELPLIWVLPLGALPLEGEHKQ